MTTERKKVQHFTWLSTISPERKIEILDECKVSSWKNPRKEIEAYIKKEYKDPIKIHRIMDEEKILKCPTELIWNSYLRQENQGSCIYCGFKFVNYLGREENKPENFKHCLGFGKSNIVRQGERELVIVYECPKCFEKSQCHVHLNWLYLFGEWIVDNSIHLDGENTMISVKFTVKQNLGEKEITFSDEAEVTSLETAKEELKELVKKFNEEEVRRYGKKATLRSFIGLIEEEGS